MIYVLQFFGVLNVFLTSYFKIKLTYFIIFSEGILLLIFTNLLQKRTIFYTLKKEQTLNNNDMKIIKTVLLIISLTFIVASPLYIMNLIPANTDIIILGSIPVLLSIHIINKLRRKI